MDIGKVIKELRQKRGITQEEFSEALRVSVQTVSRWENGVNAPDLSMLPQLAIYFRVTTDYLLGLERNDNMAKLIKTTETFERRRGLWMLFMICFKVLSQKVKKY